MSLASFARRAIARLVPGLALAERERDEALAREAAAAEVLGVIARSPGDLAPVFEAMLENATRICAAKFGIFALRDGEAFRTAALHGAPPALVALLERGAVAPQAPSALSTPDSVRETLHIIDAKADEAYVRERNPLRVALVELGGARTFLRVPLLKQNELIGLFALYRQEVRPFTDKQIALVENFAAQAVIAIENARLLTELRKRTNELTESLEQQTATSEVLGVISSSPGALAPVFDTILENAMRLCEADTGHLYRFDGDELRLVTLRGALPAFEELARRQPAYRPGPESFPATALRQKTPLHIEDVRLSSQYLAGDPQVVAGVDLGGGRTSLFVPMIRDDEAIGIIVIYRREVRPFSRKHVDLVANFAKQAVIAIENARLLTELRESLDRQTATSEVLDVIARTPGDLAPVFDAIMAHATRLGESPFVRIVLFEGELNRVVSSSEVPTAYAAFSAPLHRSGPKTAVGQLQATRQTVHILDYRQEPAYAERDPGAVAAVELGGARSGLAVPMLKEGELIGAIVTYRQEVRAFTPEQVALFENFAAQAVIAIENVRLLNELRARTDELTQSVEKLRALGEVSQAVNSTLELQTVLATIVAKAVEISATDAGAIFVYNATRDLFEQRATFGMDERLIEAVRGQRITLGAPGIGAAAAGRVPVQIADLRAEPANPVTEIILEAGFRGVLAVPLLRPDRVVGALVVRRRAPGAFAAATIDLLQTFAAQSVIAIQNARLFQEIEEKSRELAVASQHKSQFLANMSHELRTPLNAILGYTELMLDDIYGATPPRMREVLQRTERNGRHLLGLINDVLDLSKIEAGQLVLSLGSYSIQDMVQGVYLAVEPLAASKQLALTLDLPARLPAAHGDERRTAQVLLNLVGNAIKFTDAGEVKITARAANGGYIVAVHDTGPGIPREAQAKIFEEFQQADNSITRSKGGTGLGLAISKRIIEMQGGRIWVDSAPGQGSTFSFTLPVQVAAPAAHDRGK